jgi:hypothetical protein
MKAENILIEIAQENGFDTWEQYFECFRTTEPGRQVINEGILKAVNQALILSSVGNSVVCGNCDGWGYTVDENGRRKEHCKECE